MKLIRISCFLLLILTGCGTSPIDKDKRDLLVKKYDLLNFTSLPQPVFMTIDEFFDGNNDVGSIAPNLDPKPEVSEFYRVFKELQNRPNVIDIRVNISEVMIYDDGKLNNNEWFYSDIIYITGDITKEEVKEATKHLYPDAVEYDQDGQIQALDKRFEGKNVVYVWWD